MGLGFTAGVGAAMKVFKGIGVTLEIAPTYAVANVTQYPEERTGNATATCIFKKNASNPVPDNPSPNTSYLRGQPRHEFNSVAVNMGVRHGF
jgi:hypothetical protein